MSARILSQRYAQALGDTLDTESQLTTALEEIEIFAQAFDSNPELRDALINPSIPVTSRITILNDTLEIEAQPSRAKRMIQVLFERGRLSLITDLAKAFRVTIDLRLNRSVGTLTSTRELTEEQQQSIQKNISRYIGIDVHLDTQIDPDILGGVVVRIGSTVIDGSLRARLAQLKKTLLTEENGQYENSGH